MMSPVENKPIIFHAFMLYLFKFPSRCSFLISVNELLINDNIIVASKATFHTPKLAPSALASSLTFRDLLRGLYFTAEVLCYIHVHIDVFTPLKLQKFHIQSRLKPMCFKVYFQLTC